MVPRVGKFMLLVTAVFVAIALSAPISGMINIIGESSAAPVESVLRMGFMGQIDSMNPYVGLSDVSYIFYGLVYDQLQSVGNDLERLPNLAKEVRIVPVDDPELIISGEPYGAVWEFNLTNNAMWNDGVPFTAEDVAFNMNLNADNFAAMWSFQPYSYWMRDAVVIDSDTVRVHFYNRSSGDPVPVAYGDWICMPMLPKHLLEATDPFTIGFNWTGLFPSEDPPIVSTGMFMATSSIWEEWIAGDHITLVRNPSYHWAADYGKTVKFDKILMNFFHDSTSMRLALTTSQIDVAQFPPAAYYSIESDVESGLLENVVPFDGLRPDQYFTEIGINMNNAGPNPSRLDHTVRLAMAMATNKSYVTDNYYLGLADEGTTLISPFSSWHYEPNSTELIPFDIPAANAMLEAAGYVDVDSDGTRECTASSYAVQESLVAEGTELVYEMMVRLEYPEEKDIAMFLHDQWSTIGININYQVLSEGALSARVYAYAYDTVIWYWSSDPDPNYILYGQTKAAWGGWSDNKWTNDSYEESYSLSVQTTDPVERKTHVDNCQRVNYLDAPYIILAYPNQTFAWRNDTFDGWGDWAADPGRTIMNTWSANQLYFDLLPILPPNRPPTAVMIDATPDIAEVLETVAFNVSASDEDGDILIFYIDFGDGNSSVAQGFAGFTDPQYANFSHAYSATGTYMVTVWADDNTSLPGHNVSTSCVVLVQEPIPEFATVVLPIIGIGAIFVVMARKRGRERR